MNCELCNYKWESRVEDPKQCPNCKQYIIKRLPYDEIIGGREIVGLRTDKHNRILLKLKDGEEVALTCDCGCDSWNIGSGNTKNSLRENLERGVLFMCRKCGKLNFNMLKVKKEK